MFPPFTSHGNLASSLFVPILGVGTVILAFWFISKKKEGKEGKKSNKNDLWYLVKEYLKVTNRQGYRIVDLTFYTRANNIALLRDQIAENKEFLEKQKESFVSGKKRSKTEKIKKKLIKKIPFIKKSMNFPKQEEYHKKMELYTLNIIAKKYSYFQNLLNEYEKYSKQKPFQELTKKKLIGEALAKISKNKKMNSRNRYLVCFKTINKYEKISDWEAIEIELFKNPKPKSKEKFKVCFTAAIDYSKELHWIFAEQQKYLKNKEENFKYIEKQIKKDEKRKKLNNKLSFYLSIPKKIGSQLKKKIKNN
ncbi:hypothetical protein [Mycoplasma parvum]|uniref:Uncharacterized protein n=1 Tax=Mycoplasma parvum str. Indiana TaxID=1403316 RepID=U5NCH4_9MOLU|nr:hypothetical protein [Mycoplasma parvum]AGX89025.1 hypothetical protein PRV_01320 [Mycoplasma parvum str. Indiana]